MHEKMKTWCSINLDAIAHNYNYTKSRTDANVICVIKANAYGHGAVPVAQRLESEGCDFFAVSSIEEALQLREGGIKSEILILGYVLPCRIKEAVENDISFALASLEFTKELCKATFDGKAKIHIKLNTGMNRTGFTVCHSSGYSDLEQALELLKESENVKIEGVFSHFAKAESDKAFTEKQYVYFKNAVDFIKSKDITPEILHICNSAGTYNYPSMHFDAVRLGINLYGCDSDDENFEPAMEFCTRIVDIHSLKEGDGVSYGLDFIADREMKIAVIGAGYADGLFRCLSHGKGYVLVDGVKCPIIGRICMDMTMIDISGIDEAKVGNKVIIWGEGLSCNEQAKNAETISYELLCSVAPRVTRIYE